MSVCHATIMVMDQDGDVWIGLGEPGQPPTDYVILTPASARDFAALIEGASHHAEVEAAAASAAEVAGA